MRLNLDCVRDVLLCVEEHTDYRTCCDFIDYSFPNADYYGDHLPEHQLQLHKHYLNEELIYHVDYCIKAGLIQVNLIHGPSISISDLTPAGHDFLNNIREDNIWNGVKSVSSKVGAKSLEAVTQIASNVISELIRSHFKIF